APPVPGGERRRHARRGPRRRPGPGRCARRRGACPLLRLRDQPGRGPTRPELRALTLQGGVRRRRSRARAPRVGSGRLPAFELGVTESRGSAAPADVEEIDALTVLDGARVGDRAPLPAVVGGVDPYLVVTPLPCDAVPRDRHADPVVVVAPRPDRVQHAKRFRTGQEPGPADDVLIVTCKV